MIYLDCASAMPPPESVTVGVAGALRDAWGNPHSLHPVGHGASEALERARIRVAEYLESSAPEVIFMPSGRDAMARGLALALEEAAKIAGPIVSSRLEHPSTIRLVEAAAANAGRDVVWLDMAEGALSDGDRAQIETAALVVLSLVNHEMGTDLPLEDIATKGIRLIDAVQAAPWRSLAPFHDERTFYTVSAAKIGSPLGAGVLRVPARVYYESRDTGEPLEPASAPWMAAMALGEACAARGDRDQRLAAATTVADRLLAGMRRITPDALLNGIGPSRLGPIVNMSFPGVAGKDLAARLAFHRICISHTAACRSRAEEQSPVVRAAYPHEPGRAQSATRWSVSDATTEREIDAALEVLESSLRHDFSV